ncbi:hypothetical protein BH24ACT3_BH24ACT3_14470 [soil metagenome]
MLAAVVVLAAIITVPRLVGGDARVAFDEARRGEGPTAADAGEWQPLPRAPAGTDGQVTAVWTGEELVLIGAAAYNPTDETWRELSSAPFEPGPLAAAWTGSEVVAVRAGRRSAAAAYDPAADPWRELPEPPWEPIAGDRAPSARWAGDRVVVVVPSDDADDDGAPAAAFDPAEGTWAPIEPAPAEGHPMLVATGSRLELWDAWRTAAGLAFRVSLYDGEGGGWGRPLPALPAPVDGGVAGGTSVTEVAGQVVVAAGDQAVAYDRAANEWGVLPDPPIVLGPHSAVWTGERLLVWGVSADGETVGLSYRPAVP